MQGQLDAEFVQDSTVHSFQCAQDVLVKRLFARPSDGWPRARALKSTRIRRPIGVRNDQGDVGPGSQTVALVGNRWRHARR
jgi:hypothetical protein